MLQSSPTVTRDSAPDDPIVQERTLSERVAGEVLRVCVFVTVLVGIPVLALAILKNMPIVTIDGWPAGVKFVASAAFISVLVRAGWAYLSRRKNQTVAEWVHARHEAWTAASEKYEFLFRLCGAAARANGRDWPEGSDRFARTAALHGRSTLIDILLRTRATIGPGNLSEDWADRFDNALAALLPHHPFQRDEATSRAEDILADHVLVDAIDDPLVWLLDVAAFDSSHRTDPLLAAAAVLELEGLDSFPLLRFYLEQAAGITE